MLSDREREVLREIEQQFADEDPATHRRFSEARPDENHSRNGFYAAIGVCALFLLLMLMAGSGAGAAAFLVAGLILTFLAFRLPGERSHR